VTLYRLAAPEPASTCNRTAYQGRRGQFQARQSHYHVPDKALNVLHPEQGAAKRVRLHWHREMADPRCSATRLSATCGSTWPRSWRVCRRHSMDCSSIGHVDGSFVPRSKEWAIILVIDPQGGTRCLYGETIDLSRLGPLTIAHSLGRPEALGCRPRAGVPRGRRRPVLPSKPCRRNGAGATASRAVRWRGRYLVHQAASRVAAALLRRQAVAKGRSQRFLRRRPKNVLYG